MTFRELLELHQDSLLSSPGAIGRGWVLLDTLPKERLDRPVRDYTVDGDREVTLIGYKGEVECYEIFVTNSVN